MGREQQEGTMATNAGNITVADGGTLYVGAVDATAPDSEVSVLDAGFTDVGFISEDGVTSTFGKTKSGYKAWQSHGFDVKRLVTEVTSTMAFTLMEWTATSLELALSANVTEPTSGHFLIEPRDPSDGPDQRSIVLDFEDGEGNNWRWYAPVAEVEGDVSAQLQRSTFAGLPLTVTALAQSGDTKPWQWFSDSPALAGLGS